MPAGGGTGKALFPDRPGMVLTLRGAMGIVAA